MNCLTIRINKDFVFKRTTQAGREVLLAERFSNKQKGGRQAREHCRSTS